MKIPIINLNSSYHPSLFNYLDIQNIASASALKNIDQNYSSIHVTEEQDKFCIDVFVPGFKKENFKVDIDHNIIIIIAIQEQVKYLDQTNTLHPAQEYHYNMLKRSFRLPDNIVQDMISAEYNNDTLKLLLPKK